MASVSRSFRALPAREASQRHFSMTKYAQSALSYQLSVISLNIM